MPVIKCVRVYVSDFDYSLLCYITHSNVTRRISYCPSYQSNVQVRYLQKIEWLQMEHEAETGQPGYEHSGAQAALAQLNGDLTRAEQLYLENGEADKAVDMYVNLNRWEDAIRITQRMVRQSIILDNITFLLLL